MTDKPVILGPGLKWDREKDYLEKLRGPAPIADCSRLSDATMLVVEEQIKLVQELASRCLALSRKVQEIKQLIVLFERNLNLDVLEKFGTAGLISEDVRRSVHTLILSDLQKQLVVAMEEMKSLLPK